MSWCSNRTALHCTWTFCIWTFYAWKFCAWTFCVRKFTKPLSPTPSQEKIEIIFESCLFKVDEFGFFIYWKPANRVSSSIFFHYSLSVLSAGLALLVLPRTVLLELPRSAPISPIHQCIKFFPELLSVRSVLSVWSVRSFWEILSIWTVLSVQSVLQSCIGSVPSEDLLHFDGACNRFFSNHIQCLQETFLTMRTRTSDWRPMQNILFSFMARSSTRNFGRTNETSRWDFSSWESQCSFSMELVNWTFRW